MIEPTEYITPKGLKQALDNGENLELIDVRNFDEFQQIRLPHSRLISLSELPLRFKEIDTNKTVYIVCRSGQRSKQASHMLKKLGITAPYLEGGITVWKKAGHPVIEEQVKNKLSIDQQTRIAIGSLVLLGLLIPSILWWLPWFVAIMLIFAGLSDTCMMMNFLGAMPWNKKD